MARRWSILVLLLAAGSGCGRLAPQQLVAIDFVAAIDGQAWRCGRRADRPELALSQLRFFVHDLHTVDAEGVDEPAELVPEPGWTSATTTLLDFAPATLGCGEGSGGHTSLQLRTRARRIVGIRFTIGVPFPENHANPAIAEGPLAVGAMSWGWQAGYKFLALEGAVGARRVRIHVGETGCEGTFGHVSACQRPNRAVVSLRGAFDRRARVLVDLAPLLAFGVGEAERNCQGDPDGACAPAFAALGLDGASGRPAGTQTLFALSAP